VPGVGVPEIHAFARALLRAHPALLQQAERELG
jgi:hypothetical protein